MSDIEVTSKIVVTIEFVTKTSPFKDSELLTDVAKLMAALKNAGDNGLELSSHLDYENDYTFDMALQTN